MSGLYFKIGIAFFIIFLILSLIKNINFRRYLKLFFSKKIILIILLSAILFFVYILIEEITYNDIYNMSSKIVLEGKIISKKNETEYYNKYIFRSQGKRFILLTTQNLEYGDFIKIQAEYLAPDGARNFKGFDYRMYLKSQKIYGTLNAEHVEIKAKATCNIVFTLAHKLQIRIIENSRKILPKETSELFIGIMLGEKENLQEKIVENFKTSSLSHILAVSGMHVSYIILGITYIAHKAKIHKKLAYIITILFLNIFMFITNFSPSVVRACVMSILFLCSKICHRKSDIWTTIAISLLIMLVYNPYSITNIGLQLSYAGTIGIITFNQYFNKWLEKYLNKKLVNSISVILSAQIFILPMMIANFNTLSITFMFSNLLATPVVGVITIGGFILIIISFISINIAKFISPIIHISLKILILVSDVSSKIPLAQILISTPNILQIIYYYFLVVIFSFLIKNKPKRRIEQNALKLIKKGKNILILSAFIISIISNVQIPKFTINFIDVGQRR